MTPNTSGDVPASIPGTSGIPPVSAPGPSRPVRPRRADDRWWRDAVTYQIYVRSFADGNGDGLGDLAGIRSRLPHVAGLGVDAIWVNPWYPSPQADGGYDVADYRDIDPAFGTLDEARALIDEAHALGLRVLLDIVPNHTSDEHPWFAAAVAAGPGSPERDRYVFRPGTGPGGQRPPNDWRSVFGGRAWQQVTEPDGSPGEWYLHLFDVRQPDLNWENPEVHQEFLDILRFWFDLGADGFRIDVAHGMIKDPSLPDLGIDDEVIMGPPDRDDHPHWDRPGVHEIYREWRKLADSYDPPKVYVGEAWVSSAERLSRYVRPDELHTAFDFDFVRASWDAADLRRTATSSLRAHQAVGAPVMWVLSNHDITRHVTRYGRPQAARSRDPLHGSRNGHVDAALGRRRARAALLLELALPGGVYLYQGEELGLEEVEDLPEELLQDPTWHRSGHTERGRDGCRVPLPWTSHGTSLGFGSAGTWLPQPAGWADLSVQAQEADRSSMLWLYREALWRRGEVPALSTAAGDDLGWLDLGPSVVAFERDPGFACVVNVAGEPVALPDGEIVLASVPDAVSGTGADRRLAGDAAVWLSR
ncbi:MAG TPA: glycoside hydrolase family 13 protein [Kineosporiaceae bacterium]|nr:glycoside hydrolase family 13 protein [Kineosporiaceae bacterium]